MWSIQKIFYVIEVDKNALRENRRAHTKII